MLLWYGSVISGWERGGTTMQIDRRKALALLGLGAATPAAAQSSTVAFKHGVASGDPKQDRVVLWTRITPETPGADISYTWRIQKQHAITVKYLWNRRDATFSDLSDRSQTRGTLGIFYTLLGQDHFGRVDWP